MYLNDILARINKGQRRRRQRDDVNFKIASRCANANLLFMIFEKSILRALHLDDIYFFLIER